MPSPTPDPKARPTTLGELRASGWTSRTVKEELRANLLARLAADRPIVSGMTEQQIHFLEEEKWA